MLGIEVSAGHVGSGNARNCPCGGQWRSWSGAGERRGLRGVSERATPHISVKGWSLVNCVEKRGKAFPIRMAFLKGGGSRVTGSSACAAWGWACVHKSILAFGNCNKEEGPFLKLHVWAVKVCQWPLPAPTPGFWKQCPSLDLSHQAGLCWDHGRELQPEERKGSVKWFAQTQFKLLGGWRRTCPVAPCLSVPPETSSAPESGEEGSGGYSDSPVAACLCNPWECIQEPQFPSPYTLTITGPMIKANLATRQLAFNCRLSFTVFTPCFFCDATDWLKLLFFFRLILHQWNTIFYVFLSCGPYLLQYESVFLYPLPQVYQNILSDIVIEILGSVRCFTFLLCILFIFTLYVDLKLLEFCVAFQNGNIII